MSRYNTTKTPRKPDVVTHEGAAAYSLDPKIELISILLTGFDNTFYESLGDREKRFKNLISDIAKTDPDFVAKALVYARSVVGQRSATQFGAVALTPYLSGRTIARRFFSKRDRKQNKGGIVYRLDDMLEIVACYQHFNPGKPLSSAMKKGFKAALEDADTYELAKYQGKNKNVSLVDIVNLVRPKPHKDMQEAFKQLMKGELKQFNTVEDKNTKAGQDVAAKVKAGEITKEEAQVELRAAKEDNYGQLIMEGTIGYLALLRNLRNILKTTQKGELIDKACELLTNEGKIKGSLVFPHQIDLALEIMLQEGGYTVPRQVLVALDKAYELSVPNLTQLFTHGKTAVIYDTSASMGAGYSYVKMGGKDINKSAVEKAALIAATLVKGINADVYQFASTCERVHYNPLDSINTIKQGFTRVIGQVGHGTNVRDAIKMVEGKYDRVFIISDLQSATYMESSTYNKMHVYTIDLCGYGNTVFKPGSKVYQIFGYGADIYEFVKKAEVDPKAILKEIEAIEI